MASEHAHPSRRRSLSPRPFPSLPDGLEDGCRLLPHMPFPTPRSRAVSLTPPPHRTRHARSTSLPLSPPPPPTYPREPPHQPTLPPPRLPCSPPPSPSAGARRPPWARRPPPGLGRLLPLLPRLLHRRKGRQVDLLPPQLPPCGGDGRLDVRREGQTRRAPRSRRPGKKRHARRLPAAVPCKEQCLAWRRCMLLRPGAPLERSGRGDPESTH